MRFLQFFMNLNTQMKTFMWAMWSGKGNLFLHETFFYEFHEFSFFHVVHEFKPPHEVILSFVVNSRRYFEFQTTFHGGYLNSSSWCLSGV